MQKFIELGKKIYDLNNPREAHRFAVFIARCLFNRRRMKRVVDFFDGNDLLRRVADKFPYVFEQPTRAVPPSKQLIQSSRKAARRVIPKALRLRSTA